MQVTQTGADGLKRDYKVVVPAQEIEDKLTERLQTLSERARMPGFRPGKVPVSLLRKLHGQSLMGEILEETVSETSRAALEEDQVRAATQPKIEILKFEEGSDLEYSMSVEILPEIEIGDLSRIELERLVAPVDDATVDAFLGDLAKRQKSFQPVEDKDYAAKTGDAVLINYTGRIDGVEFEGGSASSHLLELGSGQFIPGFEDQLEGARAGDHLEVKVDFPADYHSAELAGKEAVFEVEVTEVMCPQDVAIDDELAKRLGLETLDELRRAVREQIESEHKRISRLRLKRSLLDKLAEMYKFEVPPGMLEMEFQMIWDELLKDLERHGKTLADMDQPEDEIRAEYRAIADRRVRLGLVLSEIGRSNAIEVRADELNRAIAEEARRFPGDEAKVFEFYRNNPEAAGQLRAPILEDKVVDFILEMAKVHEREVSRDELLRDPDDDAEAEPATKAKGKAKAKAKKATTTKAKAKTSTKAKAAKSEADKPKAKATRKPAKAKKAG